MIGKEVTSFDFSEALKQIFAGSEVAREGWNGKGMFIFYVDADDWELKANFIKDNGITGHKKSFIAMKTADNGIVPWLASQTDIVADDWVVVG